MRKTIIRLSLALGILAASPLLSANELLDYGQADAVPRPFADDRNLVTVTGVVQDETGSPVPGASVFIPGTTRGVVTDDKGKFVLEVPAATKEIKISCIGYDDVDLDIDASGRKNLVVVLKESTTFLESAVAVGYGSPKKVESLVGSVTTVNSASIRTAPSSSALDALQGQVAGLAVLTSGGVAGDNSVSMKLHGIGSLTSSSAPLYIIDGVPSSSRSIMSLNPNDIESISILKDASATSIYGARAANGVVHIITKSGSYNNDATITVRSQYGISTITDKSLYENMMSSDELARFWNIAGIHSAQYVKETFYDNGYDADTKWYNYVQQFNNPQYQNDISIEGGGQRVAYLIGASQFHQRGSAIGNVYDRFTLRSNVQGRPKDWLKVGMNMSGTYDKTIQNPNWSNSSNNRNYTSGALSYLTLPFYPAIDPETGEEYVNEYPGGMINHHTYMANRITPSERLTLMGTAFVTVDFTPDLKLSSRAGVDGYVTRYTGVMKPDYYLMGGSGWRSRSTTYNYTASLTNTLEYTYDKSNLFNFSLLAGHEEIFNDYDAWSGSVDDIINPRITLISSGDPSTYELAESQVQSAFRSFFGHGDFTFDGRYILDASIRADASSRFGASNRWGVFWSAGAMWKIKREEFLKKVVWVNDLNFKVSYGTSGNANIADYQALNLLGEGGMYEGVNGLYFAQPENPDLSWEKQALLTVALTGKVLDRLDFDVEWYHRKTTDMLMSVPIPATVGFGSQYRNVGALLNTGIDVTLGYDILRTRQSFLHFQTTFNYNAEKVLELFDGRERWEIANTGVAFVVGHPVMYYHPIYAGVDRNTGKPTWYVPNPDDVDTPTMDEVTDVFSEEALTQNTGLKRNAPVYGGFSFSGGWKGLSFLMDFSYVLGKYMINNDAYFYANPNNFADSNQHKEVSDFWTETNQDAKWPDWRQGAIMQFDTHLIEDASFLRLKNLQIAYSLPSSIMDNISFMKDLKITFTGRNLLTFTKYSGIDPEDDTNVSLGLPANSKQMLLGLELTF
ncbi:MAG: SusC/RagA family TonB-linked outer membrane protein [Bacteroidales bacterium]|nr:SusC/RagA family TonB-linked outer membrane protein [Bacteroidales bacterium]